MRQKWGGAICREYRLTFNEGCIPTRRRGITQGDAAKENARLKKELRDAQDALEI